MPIPGCEGSDSQRAREAITYVTDKVGHVTESSEAGNPSVSHVSLDLATDPTQGISEADQDARSGRVLRRDQDG